jgi:putative peptide zinc metalloprotease protein
MGMVVVSGPLFSPMWYRVASLRPCLRAHVRVHRQKYRDQVWYQLSSPMSGRRHRLNQAAYRFVGHLDGRRTAGEVWDELVTSSGDDALTQDEAIRLLGQLNMAELLQCELTPDVDRLFRQHRAQLRRKRWMELNPLAVRVRLFDPTRQLAAFDSWLAWLFCRASFVVWLAVVLPAVLIAAAHGAELSGFAAAHVDTPRYLLIAWLAYPLIKALHELGHGLAVRRWGGEVHDVGFTLFVLVPVPYVDASAASAFTRRAQRAVVSAIGIMVELFIAALAFYVWLNVQPGWVRDTAFVVMLIAAISTLAFNGNPLLRFDGYHLLCDLLDLPNLDSRSRAWWGNLIQRRLFKIDGPALPLANGERKWLIVYAPLAWSYRIYIGMLIVLWLGDKSTLLSGIVALAVGIMLIVMPCAMHFRGVLRFAEDMERRRALRVLGAMGIAILLAVTLLPMPYGTVAPAVVWLPEQAHVRAGSDGFVRELRVRDGEIVVPGQLLAVLEDPALLAGQEEANARLTGLRVRQFHAMQNDRFQAQNLAEAIAHAEAELARIDTRVAQLEVRSEMAGSVVLARQDDLPGTFLAKGQLLGYVLDARELIVRAAAPHEAAALIRERSRAANVWLEENHGLPVAGRMRRDVPAAMFRLPSAALSDRNGGAVVTDPADPEHLRTLAPVLLIDVALTPNPLQRIGGRAWVRFDFGDAPLAVQWAQALRQLLLQHFDTAV